MEACIDENLYIAKSQQYLRNVSGAIVAIDGLQEGSAQLRRMRGTEGARGGIGISAPDSPGPVCENLELPFRLHYRFDVDVQRRDGSAFQHTEHG